MMCIKENLFSVCSALIMSFCLLAISNVTGAGEVNIVYVATDGEDSSKNHAGSIDRPYRSLAFALSHAEKGQWVVMRGGRYHESAGIRGLKQVSLYAYPGEQVVFDGTVAIENISSNGKWTQVSSNIYRHAVRQPVMQLFRDGEALVPARWPNASFETGTIYTRDVWALADRKLSRNGRAVNDGSAHSLANSGLDLSDALVIANFGSFQTWTRRITQHTPGEGTFEFEQVPNFRQGSPGLYYYVEGKLEFLDQPEEWYYDPVEKAVYIWSDDKPADDYRAKVQSYAINGRGWQSVLINGIDFFATTMRCENCSDLTVENVNFDYASVSKRMLAGDNYQSDLTYFSSRDVDSGITIRNCRISHTDSQALVIKADFAVIENCEFANIDYAASDSYHHGESIHLDGKGNIFRGNTIVNAGASSALSATDWFVAEFNDISRTGFAQSDGAMIHVRIPSQTGVKVRFNWCHDSPKYGVRFDAPIPPVRWGNNGLIHHNVVWNAAGIMVKGEQHKIFHNLTMANAGIDLRILDDSSDGGGGNRGTVTMNNASDSISGHRKKQSPVPGESAANFNGLESAVNLSDQLQDPASLDFRPKENSVLLGAGEPIAAVRYPDSDSIDIGPYRRDDKYYWIPGRQAEAASRPIPADGATVNAAPVDLIWLQAWQSAEHYLYFGKDPRKVDKADVNDEEFQGKIDLESNMFSAGKLTAGDWYWRVDAQVGEDVKKGKVWAFSVK
ncbi:MAG: right-handed parallel beta-helix repeat-containing protein [Pseudomonadales bacterium]